MPTLIIPLFYWPRIESIDFVPLAAAPIGRGAVATVTNRKWKKENEKKKKQQTKGVFVCMFCVCFDHNGEFWTVSHDRAEGRRSMLRSARGRF